MQYLIRKSVVIGIGGTGAKAVLNVKKRYLEVFGEIPPTTKFLVFDTTDKESLALPSEGEIALKDSEFVKMEVRGPKQLLKANAEIREWFPENIPAKPITSGAGQIRALGRLALFANAKRVYEIIRNTIHDTKNFALAAALENRYKISNNNLLVHLVTSTAGGTGSGIFIDIAHLVREFTEETDQLVGYLLLPDIYITKPFHHHIYPNTYAAFKELDYAMNITMGETRPFVFNDKDIGIESPPFNIVFTINNQNADNISYNDENELAEIIGAGIFLLAGATGKGMGDVWDNFQSIVTDKGKWYGKSPNFLSFGLSEIRYDSEMEKRHVSDNIINDLAYKIAGGCVEMDVKSDVNTFIRSAGLEEHDADDVINALLTDRDLPFVKLPKSPSKDLATKFIGQAKKSVRNTDNELKDIAQKRFADFKDEQFDKVLSFIKEKVDMIGGLSYSQMMIAEMIGRFDECKHEMENEKLEYSEKNKSLMPQIDQAIEDVRSKAKALIGASGKIEKAIRALKDHMDRHAYNAMEYIRRDYASKFFALLIKELEKQNNRILGLKTSMSSISQVIGKRLQRYKAAVGKSHPFAITLSYVDTYRIEPGDFIKWLNLKKKMSFIELSDITTEDIESIMDEYCHSLDIIRKVESATVEEILKSMNDENKYQQMSRLDDLAVPLWKYNTAFVTGKYSTEMIYFLGTESAENTILRNDQMQSALASSDQKPTVISTGDKTRIICFKAEAALPAFIINNFEKYYEEYNDPNASFTYHRMKSVGHLPELFPPIGESENRKWWSLALASPFALITKKGSYYYIKSKSRGKEVDDYEIKLPQGRMSALKEFISDDKLVREIEKEIEKVSKKKGGEALQRELNEYCDELKRDIKDKPDISSDIKDLLEQELKDIHDYIQALGKI